MGKSSLHTVRLLLAFVIKKQQCATFLFNFIKYINPGVANIFSFGKKSILKLKDDKYKIITVY